MQGILAPLCSNCSHAWRGILAAHVERWSWLSVSKRHAHVERCLCILSLCSKEACTCRKMSVAKSLYISPRQQNKWKNGTVAEASFNTICTSELGMSEPLKHSGARAVGHGKCLSLACCAWNVLEPLQQ